MGGGFGGREHYEVEQDAVRLTAAMGRPVKVQWTRKDEFMAARNRPASAHRIRIAIDEAGTLTNWWHAYVSVVILARERLPGWLLPVARLGEDFGVIRGAHPAYEGTPSTDRIQRCRSTSGSWCLALIECSTRHLRH